MEGSATHLEVVSCSGHSIVILGRSESPCHHRNLWPPPLFPENFYDNPSFDQKPPPQSRQPLIYTFTKESPATNWYFISIDVTFFVESSFFSSTALPQAPDILSLLLVLLSLDSSSLEVQPWTLQVHTRHPCVDTDPRLIHLLWCPLPRRWSCPWLTINPFLSRKVFAHLITLIRLITFWVITVYLLILSLFPPCLMFISWKPCRRLSHPGWRQAMVE